MISRVRDITEQIKTLQVELESIQDNCEHENVIKEYKTGNGHLSDVDDVYYVWLDCPDCLKKWCVGSEHPLYKGN